MKIKLLLLFFLMGVTAGLFFCVDAAAVTDVCPPFFLRTQTGDIINPVSGENADQPYSTRKTCGACHDVDTISKGYHFMMDWDNASDDRFKNTDTPWLVSTGLTGGMTPYGYYFLAKKKNQSADEIDLTAFDFIARSPGKIKGFQKPGCAACHPGGGMLEKDRDGLRYDQRLESHPELSQTLDGDYYQSLWDKTGVIEPDCFICHSSRYSIQERIIQMKDLNFKWATVAASGIGRVQGRVIDGEVPKVSYNRRLFNEDGKFIMPEMVFKPKPKNCLICHESIELGKRGFSWDDPLNPDVHQWSGLDCIDCHPGDIRHNFAKGNAMANRVAQNLDNTMKSCRDCHTTGFKGAPLMRHNGIKKDHLDKLSCEACHIPQIGRSSVGAMMVVTGRFGKIGQINTKRFGEHKPWKPAYTFQEKDGRSKIVPVNPFYADLFTNKRADGIFEPLFLSEIKKAHDLCLDRLSQRDDPNDFHNPDDIIMMLKALTQTLETNPRFEAIHPVLHQGGNLYELDKSGKLLKTRDLTWVSKIPFFSVSHNVAPAHKALGAGGCRDCHSKNSHIFHGRVVKNFFGPQGRPVTLSMPDFMNFSKSKQVWLDFFAGYLNAAAYLFAGIFMVTLVACGYRAVKVAGADDSLSAHMMHICVPMGLLAVLGAGHLLFTKDTGLFTRAFSAPWILYASGFCLIIPAGLIFGRRSVRNITNPRIRFLFVLVCSMAVISGFILWALPVSGGGKLIVVSIHGIFVMLAVIFVFVLAVRSIKNGD